MTTGADRRPLIYAAAAMLVAAMGSSLLWGFTVDDALISARVAHHLAMGLGHRFNPQGPVVDAVTPLGWAYVLMPFAKGGPLAALDAARWIGVGCSTLSAGLVGVWVSERGTGLRGAAPLLLLALSFPFAAWSVTGMETPVVTLLATLALWPGSGGALAAGLAAAWRPELLPWALVLSVGGAVARGASPRGRVFAAIAALGPALAIAASRAVVFGNPAPLAVFAKPSDTAHGLFYAAVAVLWSGAPALCLTVAGWARVDARVRAIAVASAVHVVSLVLAGGDWMPYSRLLVPVLPGVICVASAVSSQAQPWALGLRWLLVAVPVTVLMTQKLSETRAVYASRLELVRRLAAGVDPNATVASVDVGWVGAATSGRSSTSPA